jgi:hypothetical protein
MNYRKGRTKTPDQRGFNRINHKSWGVTLIWKIDQAGFKFIRLGLSPPDGVGVATRGRLVCFICATGIK